MNSIIKNNNNHICTMLTQTVSLNINFSFHSGWNLVSFLMSFNGEGKPAKRVRTTEQLSTVCLNAGLLYVT